MRYLYVIYALLTFVIGFLIRLPFILLFSLDGVRGRKATWKLVQLWSIEWFFLIGIRSRRIFEAPLDPNKGPYIVVANHISYMDIPILFRTLPFYARPLAKFELGKIPLFGFLYKQLAVTIDRSSGKSKLAGVHKLKDTINEGGSILIFPEGTFNETGAPLKSFYDGAFRVAIETQAPILPVVFLDALSLWHYKSFWSLKPGINRTVFMPVIDTARYGKDMHQLKEDTFKSMEQAILQYK
ncbi:1-acyl-sn-glycerol-3-phosphate acyltransferase [compost metagenome]